MATRPHLASGSLWIFLALILIVVVFTIMKPSAFLGSYNIKSIFIDASVALMLVVGMTFVIITAGIDLVGRFGARLLRRDRAQGDDRRWRAGHTPSTNAGWGMITLGIARRARSRPRAGAC